MSMARIVDILIPTGTIRPAYPIRAEYRVTREFFMDYVLGGARDQAVSGLVRVTPRVRLECDISDISLGTVTLGSTIPTTPIIGTVRITADGLNYSLRRSRGDTWEVTWEEGRAATEVVEFIGEEVASDAPVSYVIDYTRPTWTIANCTIRLDGVPLRATRWSFRVNNNLQPLYFGTTLPTTIIPQQVEVEGRVRIAGAFTIPALSGSIDILCPNATIVFPSVRITEAPPSVRGMELSETEFTFRAFPGLTGGVTTVIRLIG